MKRIWFYLFVLLAFNNKVAFCCLCGVPESVQKAFASSDAVFVGHAVLFVPSPSLGRKTYLFQVSKSWKGVSANTVTVNTGIGGGDCGYPFEVGQEYLVYASGTSRLVTEICSRTTPLLDAEQQLTVLGPGTPHSSA